MKIQGRKPSPSQFKSPPRMAKYTTKHITTSPLKKKQTARNVKAPDSKAVKNPIAVFKKRGSIT